MPQDHVMRIGHLADKLLPKALRVDGGEAGVVDPQAHLHSGQGNRCGCPEHSAQGFDVWQPPGGHCAKHVQASGSEDSRKTGAAAEAHNSGHQAEGRMEGSPEVVAGLRLVSELREMRLQGSFFPCDPPGML